MSAKRTPFSNHLDYDYLIKFLALGDSSVGKSSSFQQWALTLEKRESRIAQKVLKEPKAEVNEYIFNCGILLDKKGTLCKFSQSDGTGYTFFFRPRFRSLTTAFFRDSMGFLLLFDLTNEQSFLSIRSWLEQLKTHAYTESPDIVLIGNKADLEDERVITEQQAKETASRYGLPYIETSAATGENVALAVEMLLGKIMLRMESAVEDAFKPAQRGKAVQLETDDNSVIASSNGPCSC